MTNQTREEFKKAANLICVQAVFASTLGILAGANAFAFVLQPALPAFIGGGISILGTALNLIQIKKSLNKLTPQ